MNFLDSMQAGWDLFFYHDFDFCCGKQNLSVALISNSAFFEFLIVDSIEQGGILNCNVYVAELKMIPCSNCRLVGKKLAKETQDDAKGKYNKPR